MATPPDANQLLAYVAAELKVALVDLPTSWTTLAGQAAPQAYANVSGVMAIKGYSAAQILSWDFLAQYCLSQGLYLMGVMGANYADYSDKFVIPQDQCGEKGFLRTQGVIIASGDVVAPDGTSPVGGVVGGGGSGLTVAEAARAFDRLGTGCGWVPRWRC